MEESQEVDQVPNPFVAQPQKEEELKINQIQEVKQQKPDKPLEPAEEMPQHVHGPNCNHDHQHQHQHQHQPHPHQHVHGEHCSHSHQELSEEQQEKMEQEIAKIKTQKIQSEIKKLQHEDIVSYRRQIKNLEREKELFRQRDFWDTQPVPKLSSKIKGLFQKKDGPLEIKTIDDVRKDPYKLPPSYEWFNVDMDDEKQVKKLYKLLTKNYVEDDDNMFRFDYSPAFLNWALTPPGQYKDWIVGVRTKKKKMVGCITGIPLHMNVDGKKVKMVEINFLCVHKKLREKRLAPVLIKEITRRVNLKKIWQAVYTSGQLLPTPVAKAQYYHRSLNPKKLVACKFSYLKGSQTVPRLEKLYRLPKETTIPGLRPMKKKDIIPMTGLLKQHLKQYRYSIHFNQEEVMHWFLTRQNVIYTYVIEKEKQITDIISFYRLSSSVLKHDKYDKIDAAYGFYNITTTITPTVAMKNALILAKMEKFDVFNALNTLNNQQTFEVFYFMCLQNIQDLLFHGGSGNLHFYLYNWNVTKRYQPEEVGIVLL